jgi:hypothetical protein
VQDKVTEQFSRWYTKGSLLKVELQLNLAQVGKGLEKVIDERILTLTLHDNVVDVGLNVAPDLRVEALPDGPLKGISRVLEPKGHTSVAVATYWRDEHYLIFILHRHLNLVVARERVEEAQQVTACRGVQDLVDARQRKRILWAALVEICEVDARPHSPVRLWNYNGVRLPHGVHHLSDHLGLLKLPHFLDDEIMLVLRLTMNLLLDGACLGAHR